MFKKTRGPDRYMETGDVGSERLVRVGLGALLGHLLLPETRSPPQIPTNQTKFKKLTFAQS